MPLKPIRTRLVFRPVWQRKSLPVERIVRVTVIEVFLQQWTNFETMIRGYRHVASVEQAMQVRAQQQAVGDFVWSFV